MSQTSSDSSKEDKLKQMKDDYHTYLNLRMSLRPFYTGCRIVFIYFVIGLIYLICSDLVPKIEGKNDVVYGIILQSMDYFFLFGVGLVLLYLIVRQLRQCESAMFKILHGYEVIAKEQKGYLEEQVEVAREFDECQREKQAVEKKWMEAQSAQDELVEKLEEVQKANIELEQVNKILDMNGNMLQHIAFYDQLTGLPNRRFYEEEVQNLLQESKLNPLKFTLIYLDIDDFKHINDTLGHDFGDYYIIHIGNILTNVIDMRKMVARFGADEFAVLLYDIDDLQEINRIVYTISNTIKKPWEIDGRTFYLTVSMGVTIFPNHGGDYKSLLQNVDIAVFHQKELGKNGYTIYEPYMAKSSFNFIQMNHELRTALKRHEFLLYYQGQYDVLTGKAIGVEALIRWKHPERGFIPPLDFISFSEKTGFIIPISKWVLKEAFRQKAQWNTLGHKTMKMSINLSGQMIFQEDLVHQVEKLLKEYQLDPCEIELEVTETAVMTKLAEAKKKLKALRDLGISIAIDDFGTGYSSLVYLQELPCDILKIDREFIKHIESQNEDSYIYNAIVDLAHNLGLKVVTEGVETWEQDRFLFKNHSDIGQGYYFSKPVPHDEAELLFHR